MKAKMTVTVTKELGGEFEGETLNECIANALQECRATGEVINQTVDISKNDTIEILTQLLV